MQAHRIVLCRGLLSRRLPPAAGVAAIMLGNLYSGAASSEGGRSAAKDEKHAYKVKARAAYSWAKTIMVITHGANDRMVQTLNDNLANLYHTTFMFLPRITQGRSFLMPNLSIADINDEKNLEVKLEISPDVSLGDHFPPTSLVTLLSPP
jgi:hypothetical protein